MTTENWRTIDQSHVRERNACQPSWSSRRKFADCSRTTGARCINAVNTAPSPNVAASTAIAHPGLVAATMMPPIAAPNTFMLLIASRSSAFACWIRLTGTVCGTIPCDAGK